MNRIIGLDVGRGSAVLCCISEFPDNIQQRYKQLKNTKQFHKVDCSRLGVEKLLSLKPTGIVLEPTGYWYSQFWVMVAQKYDILIYWIGHTDLSGQRSHYGFTNKRDEEDALCLTACYFDPQFVNIHGQKRFINLNHDLTIMRIRGLFNQKEQLQKLRTNLVSQLRQRLSYEFPEIARHTMTRSTTKGYTPIIYWLAFNHSNFRYDNKYKLSIAPELGIQISTYTRHHSQTIIDLELRYSKHLEELDNLIALPQFDVYNQVFDRFKFATSCRAILLINLYPIDKFLVDGQSWIEYETSKGKRQKRDRSLRKFQACLGLSFSYSMSGGSFERKFHGNSMVRSHLYAWAYCLVSRKGNLIGNDIGKQLSDRYQELRKTVKGKDSLIRILFKATRILFYELIKANN
ncbi:MAG: hypothetical protein KME09_16330 [Pleurocapsa minor HA4230-MV1]|jgi:hypothetical protein|nr:hypothetical protein [Pleurocapsa minor HA4230-MV1]